MDGHKKIREITGDSAQLKEDYLEEDKVAFLVLAKYSNAAFSLSPPCPWHPLPEQEQWQDCTAAYMAVTHGITLTQDSRQAGKFSKSGEWIYPKQEV